MNLRRWCSLFVWCLMFLLASVSWAKKAPLVRVDHISGLVLAEKGWLATWSGKRLTTRLRYECMTVCGKKLRVELRTVGGRVLGRKSFLLQKTGAKGAVLRVKWRRRVSLQQAELLVLRYQYRWQNQKIARGVGVGKLLDGPKLTILGSRTWYGGAAASLRVMVVHRCSGRPYTGAKLVVHAKGIGTQRCTIATSGSCELRFVVPDRLVGKKVKLRLRVNAPMGARTRVETIAVSHKVRLLLTTDKPSYQPGQRIYLRALAMQVSGDRALGNAKVHFQAKDGRGNLVFSSHVKTNDFGIAHKVFALAKQVNEGSYQLKATLTKPGGKALISTRTVKVYRYQLPTFRTKFLVKQRYLLYDKQLSGEVSAQYLFGKPVQKARVKVEAWLQGAGAHKVFSYDGTTNESGLVPFKLRIPQAMRWVKRRQGSHRTLYLAASVTAPSGEQRRVKISLPLATAPLQVQFVPEFLPMIRGLRQRLFVLTTRPDGSPIAATLHMKHKLAWSGLSGIPGVPKATTKRATSAPSPTVIRTDAAGWGQVWVTPKGKQWIALGTLKDAQGNRAPFQRSERLHHKPPRVIARAQHALYREGDTLQLSVHGDVGLPFAYIDIFRSGHLFRSLSVPLKQGKGVLSVPLEKGCHGLLRFVTYPSPKQGLRNDVRRRYARWHVGWVYVQRAGDLKLRLTLDKPSYRPKEMARVKVQVTDNKGQPVQAALGIQIVDQAVAVLAGKSAALDQLRTFFRLKRAVFKSSVRVPRFGPTQLVSGPTKGAAWERRRRLAAVLLAAASPHVTYSLSGNTEDSYTRRVGKQTAKLARRVVKRIGWRVVRKLKRFLRKNITYDPCGVSLFPEAGRWLDQLRTGRRYASYQDPWGNLVSLDLAGLSRKGHFVLKLKSYGFDEVEDSDRDRIDDISFNLRFYVKPKPNKPFRPCSGKVARWYGRGGARIMGRYGGSGVRGIRVRGAGGNSWAPAKVRHYFPELLFQHPSMVTSPEGKAQFSVKMADSITSWDITALASTKRGLFGIHRGAIRVFQPFFVKASLPSALERGDRVTLAVMIHNHRDQPDDVHLVLKPAPWYQLTGDVPATSKVKVGPQAVKVVKFMLQIQRAGTWMLRLRAQGAGVSDALVKTVSVHPGGLPVVAQTGGYVRGEIKKVIDVPAQAIPDSDGLSLEIAPGPVAETMEGLDSLLREPHGCFEQTSSSTYPNVLILQHYQSRLRRKQRVSKKVMQKALGFVAKGYQRLLTFEVRGGGFSLYGRAPADVMLTSYGLHEFLDMAQVHPVDVKLLVRTRRYLVQKQGKDGAWLPSRVFPDPQRATLLQLRTTAYAAWALARFANPSKREKAALRRALQYMNPLLPTIKEPYTLALVGQFLASSKLAPGLLQKVLLRLKGMRNTSGESASWPYRGATLTRAHKRHAVIETSALVMSLLLDKKQKLQTLRRGLHFLAQNKSPRGGWGNTQATVLALRAVLAAQRKLQTSEARGTLAIDVNGQVVKTLAISPKQGHLLRRIDLGQYVQPGQKTKLVVRFRGKGVPTAQIKHHYHVPFGAQKAPTHPRLRLKVERSKTLRPGAWGRVQVEVTNPGRAQAFQPLVKVGLGAGFRLHPLDMARWVKQGTIARFEQTERHLVIYLQNLKPGAKVALNFRLRAQHKAHVTPAVSSVYEYYRPTQVGYFVAPAILVE